MLPKVFLLHGWNMPPKTLAPLSTELEKSFDVRLGVMPGYEAAGKSDVRCEDTLAQVVDFVFEQAPDDAHWIGWSLGATVAASAALMRPEKIAKLTLLAPTPSFVARPDWQLGFEQKFFDKLLNISIRRPEAGASRFLTLQAGSSDSSDNDWLESSLKAILANPPSKLALQQGHQILCNTDLRNQLSKLQVPTQVIAASEDNVIPPAASQFMAEQILHAKFHSIGDGHAFPISHVKDVANAIQNFHDTTERWHGN